MNEIEVLEPEVVGKQLVEVEQASGIEQDTALALRGQFADFYNDIVEWRGKAAMVTQPEDATHQKIAREVRLGLKKVRCDVENTRKALKADSLARSKAIDGFANVLKYLCEPIENKLMEVEQYAERQEAARIAALVADRKERLAAEQGSEDFTNEHLEDMSEEMFNSLLEIIRKNRIERQLAAAKAESDRIAREKAEADERERIRKENERLKKEAADREAAAAKERAKIAAERAKEQAEAEKARKASEAKLKTEREAREKAEREAAEAKRKELDRIAAEKAAEEAKAKADKEAKRKAARAPDKKKLESFADAIDEICPPEMATDEGAAVMNDAVCQMKELTQWLRDAARVM